MLSLRHKGAVGALHLLACFGGGPEFAECALAHPGGKMVVEVRIVGTEAVDEFLDGLAYGVSVVRTGRGEGREAMICDGVDNLLFAEIDKGTDDSDVRLVKIGLWAKGVQLPRVNS